VTRVNIAGLDRAEIIAALYNASQPLGMGFLHYDPAPMMRDEAQAYLDQMGDRPYFIPATIARLVVEALRRDGVL
jgi:hypothetical protein